MRVVATKFYQSADVNYFRRELPEVEFWFPQTTEDLKSLRDVISDVDVFLGPPPSSDILKSAIGSLRLIQIPWSGVDGIDFSFCKKHSIVCANSHSGAISVAELAITLCLDVLKGTSFNHIKFCDGNRSRPKSVDYFFLPKLLTEKSVGIFGYGAIGKKIHSLLEGFNCEFSSLSYSKKNKNIRRYDRKTEFLKFLSRLDVLFITAPLTKETRNILNYNTLSYMKKTSIIVNVSRAELVDIEALHNSLAKKKLAGVALDVHWKNLSARDQMLADEIYSMRNVVSSPHLGGFVSGELLHLKGAIDNIRKVFNGNFDEIVGVIDFDKGY